MSASQESTVESQSMPDLVFVLVFDALPAFDIGRIADGIRACEPLQQDVTYELDAEGEPGFSAQVMFDNHHIHLVGLSVPFPASIVEQAVNGSKFHPKLTGEILGHRAHIMCFYKGRSEDPLQQMMALEKVAQAFLPMGVLGLLDSGAWNCRPRIIMEKMPVTMLRNTFQAEPHLVSLGFVKFFKDDGVWFCTKGHHRFGLPDFAWLATLKEAEAVYNAFGKLFLDLRASGARPQPGDTAALGQRNYARFREVYEFADWLNGPAGTLVVEPADEVEARTGGPTGAGALHEEAPVPMVMVKQGDEAMELAFAEARETLSHFWEVFAQPQNGETDFGLKVKLSDRYGTEQMWIGDIEQKDGQIHGRVNNEPKYIKSVKCGQRIVLAPDEIMDWFYNRNGKMVGNYTARVLVRMMPPNEAKKFRDMASDFLPLKLSCACGQRYAFEIEAVGGKMPHAMQCPACGADGTAAANAKLAVIFDGKVAQAAAPRSENRLSISARTQAAPPPIQTTSPARAPARAGTDVAKVLTMIGLAFGGGVLVLVLGVALLMYHYSPNRRRPSAFPDSRFPQSLSSPRGGVSPSRGPDPTLVRPVFLNSRHATFRDLRGKEYNDVILTIADSRGLSYFKPGDRPGVIPYADLSTDFLVSLGVPTNWPGVLK